MLPPDPCGEPMCEMCIEIDRTIERFRQVERSISDDLTIDRAKETIHELETKKAELHQVGAASRGIK
jgi:hypothetical protein